MQLAYALSRSKATALNDAKMSRSAVVFPVVFDA